MSNPDLAPIAGQSWESLSYREAMARLIEWGWTPCGIGDWAVALRSPSGEFAARVCPFDPAYTEFLELCRRCAGNPYLPRVEVALDLDGGASLTVMEFLAPVTADVAGQVKQRWQDGAGAPEPDRDFDALRRAAIALDAECRDRVPWWERVDLNEGNVRRAIDGRLVLTDIFCIEGAALYGQIRKDVSVVHDRIPRSRMRYALDIPFIARESSPDEIRALRQAWAAQP
jgi:hypothetical protein